MRFSLEENDVKTPPGQQSPPFKAKYCLTVETAKMSYHYASDVDLLLYFVFFSRMTRASHEKKLLVVSRKQYKHKAPFFSFFYFDDCFEK